MKPKAPGAQFGPVFETARMPTPRRAFQSVDAVPVGGQIIAVAPSINPATRSVMARASIGATPSLIPGHNVTVSIRGSGTGIAVPQTAVTRIGDKDHVFVRKGKTWVKRPVEVAARGGGEAFIAKGLAAGETVAASSIAELKAMSAE